VDQLLKSNAASPTVRAVIIVSDPTIKAVNAVMSGGKIVQKWSEKTVSGSFEFAVWGEVVGAVGCWTVGLVLMGCFGSSVTGCCANNELTDIAKKATKTSIPDTGLWVNI
jgi:hypothetical protein